ncbi:hypothetical protein E3Q22_02825 [Wallemia mellicola]|uniref:Uncharacterized protein n=1 Tax=Wallemia mellicola TaxID=1708541 RepID=A0A4T0M5C9_9BASI|nr:hypothetical protein E3Q22_02825 [Wallemia mellicola]
MSSCIVLAELKQSHGYISYGHRFKAAARSWTTRLQLTQREYGENVKVRKDILQTKAFENAQRDLNDILYELRQSIEISAQLEEQAGDNFDIDVPRANSDYNRHMQTTLAKLKDEQPNTPYQARFKYAASLWQDKKKVHKKAVKDARPLYTNEAIANKPTDEDLLLENQQPSSSTHEGRLPMSYFTNDILNDDIFNGIADNISIPTVNYFDTNFNEFF